MTRANTSDVIVIGSGINGLVAAAELARAGRSVTVVERNDEIGGFVASEARTIPGYIHDTYSSWHPLFLAGPAYAALGDDLHRHGLEYSNTDGFVTASVADDGRVVVAHRDPEATAAGFTHERDRVTYLSALGRFVDNAEQVGALLGTELHSPAALRHGLTVLRRTGLKGGSTWARDLVSSGRAYCRRSFDGTEVDHLWTPWLLHAGLSPDQASGGFMLPVMAATMHGFGLPVVTGGSGRFVDAFRRLLDELGVRVITGAEAETVVTEDGRAVGVIAAGRLLRARHAVLASVTPQALYGSLLEGDPLVREPVADDANSYRYGRGAMQIHVALSAPLSWNDARLSSTPLIHLSDGSSSTGIACAQAEADLLPSRPTVVVGQQYVVDPSRVPEGAASLWIQLQEVPYAPRGDAAGELDTSDGWTKQLAQEFANRVLARIVQHAPDLDQQLRAVDVVTPVDLEAHNPNAVHGDPYGGAAELDQNFHWRPLPSSGSHRTSVPGLWHIGSSTHPGPGLGGASGHLVAQSIIARRSRLPRRTRRSA